MAALGCFQEFYSHPFAGFVISAAGQLPANGLQRHFQIGSDSSVKVRHDT
jgi:hypothetical protein